RDDCRGRGRLEGARAPPRGGAHEGQLPPRNARGLGDVQLHPTRSTFHVAVAGAGLVALGAAARLAPVVAFGGAMLLAVALGRAIALVAVTRLRAAGFEMVWTGPTRVQRVARGGTIVLEAELRNRGADAVRGAAIRPL